MQLIPSSLAPFFQEYDITSLNLATASFTIIERTLQFGNREELRWLFSVYSRTQIADWVGRFGKVACHNPTAPSGKLFWSLTDERAFLGYDDRKDEVRIEWVYPE